MVLQNGKLALTLSTKGGTVAKAVIKDYVGHNLKVQDGSKDTKDVTLFEGNDQRLNYLLSGKELNIETEDLYFTPSNVTDSTVTMTAEAAPGKTLTLDSHYVMDSPRSLILCSFPRCYSYCFPAFLSPFPMRKQLLYFTKYICDCDYFSYTVFIYVFIVHISYDIYII